MQVVILFVDTPRMRWGISVVDESELEGAILWSGYQITRFSDPEEARSHFSQEFPEDDGWVEINPGYPIR